MKIPTIFKGDDSGPIVLVMDDDHDYTGATLVVAYSGVTRKFTDLTPGGTVSLAFTHDETAGFNLGCKPVLMRLIGPSGAVETVENAEMKIKVTDCLGEVNAGGSFVVRPGAANVPVTDIGDIPTTASVGALYAKVNEIVRVLAQRSLLSLAALLSAAAFATVQTATLENLNPSSVVVTNVVESAAIDTNAVRDIALYPATNYTDRATGEVIRLLEDKVDKAYGVDIDSCEVRIGLDRSPSWKPFKVGGDIDGFPEFSIYCDNEEAYTPKFGLTLTGDTQEIPGMYSARVVDFSIGDKTVDGQAPVMVRRDINSLKSDFTTSVQRIERQLDDKADASALAPVAADASSALTYSRFVYDFCLGSASCHLITTNYVFGSDATNRTRFAWQSDMDAGTVPASMRLVDIVGGETNVVWDSRDWTVWYWNYRLAKYRAERETEDDALRALIARRAPINWASYTACGLTNPAATTTWLDTPSVVLSAGYAWQHQLDVGGVGYWCIQGNGFEVGGSGTNATLKISDFEGNEVFKIRKGNARLAPVSSEMTESVGFDGDWFWCQMKCDAEPEGEFAVDLAEGFYPEGDTCPAVVREYEDRGGGVCRCYWKVRPGIQSASCFGRFKVQVGSETTVEYSNAPTVPAIRFGNYKLEPVIPSGARVGDTVTFKITKITQ